MTRKRVVGLFVLLGLIGAFWAANEAFSQTEPIVATAAKPSPTGIYVFKTDVPRATPTPDGEVVPVVMPTSSDPVRQTALAENRAQGCVQFPVTCMTPSRPTARPVATARPATRPAPTRRPAPPPVEPSV